MEREVERRWTSGEEDSFDGMMIIEAPSRRIPTVFNYFHSLRKEEVPLLSFRVHWFVCLKDS